MTRSKFYTFTENFNEIQAKDDSLIIEEMNKDKKSMMFNSNLPGEAYNNNNTYTTTGNNP